MNQSIDIRALYKKSSDYLGQKITVSGWIRTTRESKNAAFIELNDGTFFKNLQVVYDEKLANFSEISKINIGASLSITGSLVESAGAEQPFELKADEILVVGESLPEYPLQKKRHTFEFLREIAHLRARSNTFSAVFRVRSLAAFAIHKFYNERGFVYVHAPIVTASDCEGAGEMFQVTTMDLKHIPKNEQGEVVFKDDFFGKKSGLTVSGQLEAETYAMAFRKVYTFGPTFRAENSNTKRHASEFWMIEPEIAFSGLKEDMALAEEFVKYVINYVRENAPEEMAFFNKFIDTGLNERLDIVVNSPFEHVTYTEAVEVLTKSGQKFEFPVVWGKELQTEHEKYLTEVVYKKPVFVTDYPRDIKAFYMRQNDDGKTVAAMDLLVPGVGEIIGGSQREERLEKLIARMEEMHLEPKAYWWYLDLRRYGGTPQAGFGLGFERLIMYLTGMENIRDVIPYPRTPKNAEF